MRFLSKIARLGTASVVGAAMLIGGLATVAGAWTNNPPVEATVGVPFTTGPFVVDENCYISAVNTVQGSLPAGLNITLGSESDLTGGLISGVATANGGFIYSLTQTCFRLELVNTGTWEHPHYVWEDVNTGSSTEGNFTLLAVSNGAAGANGANGTNGVNGVNGTPGPAGANGVTTIVNTLVPYAQLEQQSKFVDAHGAFYRFQTQVASAPNAKLLISFWQHTAHGYTLVRTVEAPLSQGVFVHTGWAIKVRTIDPTSNVLVRLG